MGVYRQRLREQKLRFSNGKLLQGVWQATNEWRVGTNRPRQVTILECPIENQYVQSKYC